MSKKSNSSSSPSNSSPSVSSFPGADFPTWLPLIETVADRFDREYRGESFELPDEVEAMPIFRDRMAGTLTAKIASPFWELVQPKKNQQCLDVGCGVSFLIYPWRDWNAFFYGQDISTVARDALNSRGPQLNSKLFKGVKRGPAHLLQYDADQFDLVIATGFSCYYPMDYWDNVLSEVKRVLKPGGSFVFDVIDPDVALAEDWAILETYLGTEVYLEAIADWESLLTKANTKVIKRKKSELFQMYHLRFA
jgi:SAM-dependent methyltransferase